MDDIRLAIAIRQGDSAAFKILFERYYEPLLAYITTFTHNPPHSQDIVQQAFVTLWLQRDKLNIEKSPKAYLYAIAHNGYIDQYRILKRRDEFFDELKEHALRERITDDKELTEQRIGRLKDIVKSLPPRCREILQLNKQENLTYKEIALQLKISVKTVEAQMRIAFQKIREGFKNDGMFLFMLLKRFKGFKSG